MTYIFKQKLQLADLVLLEQSAKRIIIFEPEEYLAALYGHYLRKHNFDIKHCPEFAKLQESIINFNPDLLILGLDAPEFLQKSTSPARLIKDFPNLKIISTSYNLNSQGISELMSAGVVSHINRRLSRPEDLALIVKTILE